MLVLFARAVFIYILVFVVIRLCGKRQLSQLQPSDLVITLLIADLASQPVSDTSIPLSYGVVPIIALFLVNKLISYISLKSERFRSCLSGRPLVVIANGVVQEDVMRQARYTMQDLMEHLRTKDVFTLSDVWFAILETGGNLTVLLKGEMQNPTYSDMNLPANPTSPCNPIILDGRIISDTMLPVDMDKQKINSMLSKLKLKQKDILFAVINADSIIHIQTKLEKGAKTYFIDSKGDNFI